MKKYTIEPLPSKYYYEGGKAKWFEDMDAVGWELVGPDYTRTNFEGRSNTMVQYYIFRKEEINFNKKETII